MAALATVADYISEARVLLQDTVAPYRYPDADLVAGLNLAVLEARRLRSDLFLGVTTLPTYSAASTGTTVAIDEQYRVAFVYYVCGHAQLRDDEGNQDVRAGTFLKMFATQLTSLA